MRDRRVGDQVVDHELPQVLDRALDYCLKVTRSEFGFVGLLNASKQMMDVAAIKGFEPLDPTFYERFRLIPVRPTLFGTVVLEGRICISNDVINDPRRVGQPSGHPPVRTYLGVPLRVGSEVIGMVRVGSVGSRLIRQSHSEGIRFPAFALFMLLWSTVIYLPLAHWVGDAIASRLRTNPRPVTATISPDRNTK